MRGWGWGPSLGKMGLLNKETEDLGVISSAYSLHYETSRHAYCNSQKCGFGKRVEKFVDSKAFQCPDCEHILYWESETIRMVVPPLSLEEELKDEEEKISTWGNQFVKEEKPKDARIETNHYAQLVNLIIIGNHRQLLYMDIAIKIYDEIAKSNGQITEAQKATIEHIVKKNNFDW